MEAKFVIYFVLFLALFGLGFGVYHTTEIDEANKELASAVQQVETLEAHIKTQTAQLELRREVAALMTVADIMQKEVNSIRDDIANTREDEIRARKDFEQAILKSRQDAAGLVLDEAVLPSGLRLRNARVQKVEGDTTTILHSEGISKLSPEMLPQELQERFRFGAVQSASEKPAMAAPAPAVDTAVVSSAPLQKDKLKEARFQLEKLKKDLPYLEDELTKAESDTFSAASPSRRFYAKNRRDTLSQQVTALKRQIDAAELAVRKMESEE